MKNLKLAVCATAILGSGLLAMGQTAPGSMTPERRQKLYQRAWTAVQPFYPTIQQAASDTGVDPILISAVITVESAGQINASSRVGAMGLMQLMPGTAADLGVNDPFDPTQNIRGGSTLLARLLTRYGGDLTKALAAYNAGGRRVDDGSWRSIRETVNYVATVIDIVTAVNGGQPVTNLKIPGNAGVTILPPVTPSTPPIHWLDVMFDIAQNSNIFVDQPLSENGSLDDAADTLMNHVLASNPSADKLSAEAAKVLTANHFVFKSARAFSMSSADPKGFATELAKLGQVPGTIIGFSHATNRDGHVWVVVIASK